MWSSVADNKFYKKYFKKTQIDFHIHPFADFYNFWCVVSYRRRHPYQILSRLVKGLGATATQNRGFPNPINFYCRSYNSVTH